MVPNKGYSSLDQSPDEKPLVALDTDRYESYSKVFLKYFFIKGQLIWLYSNFHFCTLAFAATAVMMTSTCRDILRQDTPQQR